MQPQIEQSEAILTSVALSSGWSRCGLVRIPEKKCCPQRGHRRDCDTGVEPFDGNVASQDVQRIVRNGNVAVIVGMENVTVVEDSETLATRARLTRAGGSIVV